MKMKSILRSLALTVAVLAVSTLLGACKTHESGHMHQHADGSMHHHEN